MQAKQSKVKEQSLRPSKHAVLHGVKQVIWIKLQVLWQKEEVQSWGSYDHMKWEITIKVTNHVWVSNKHSNLGKVNEMHKLT